MELGCGVRVKAIKGHDYLYVWHYERDEARRRQVYDYIGPASDSDARRRAIDSLEGHARRAIEEARHRIEAGRSLAGSAGRGRGTPWVRPPGTAKPLWSSDRLHRFHLEPRDAHRR